MTNRIFNKAFFKSVENIYFPWRKSNTCKFFTDSKLKLTVSHLACVVGNCMQFTLETLLGFNQQQTEPLRLLTIQLFCYLGVKLCACFSCQLGSECWRAEYRINWKISIGWITLVEAVSNLDRKAASVYWGMQQCEEWAWVINAWGQEGVWQCGSSSGCEQVEFMPWC